MPYWQLYYHLVWATRDRIAALTPDVEPIVQGLLRQKAVELEATVHALNGVEDHVHLVVEIPPKIAVARFVGQVKAFASAQYNKRRSHEAPPFFWQAEYGAFSFSRKQLRGVVEYVERQKEHHATGNVIAALESMA